jgi:hypothetical protein
MFDNLKELMQTSAERTVQHNVIAQQREEIVALRQKIDTLAVQLVNVEHERDELRYRMSGFENQLLERNDRLTLYFVVSDYELEDGEGVNLYIWAPTPDFAVSAWHAEILQRRIEDVATDPRVFDATCSVALDAILDISQEDLPTWGGGVYSEATFQRVYQQVCEEIRKDHFEKVAASPVTVLIFPLVPPPNPDGRSALVVTGYEVIE